MILDPQIGFVDTLDSNTVDNIITAIDSFKRSGDPIVLLTTKGCGQVVESISNPLNNYSELLGLEKEEDSCAPLLIDSFDFDTEFFFVGCNLESCVFESTKELSDNGYDVSIIVDAIGRLSTDPSYFSILDRYARTIKVENV